MSPVQTLAHSVSSIRQEHFFVAPTWGAFATFGAYLLVALYVILLLPRLSAGKGAMITAGIFVALFAAHLGEIHSTAAELLRHVDREIPTVSKLIKIFGEETVFAIVLRSALGETGKHCVRECGH